ncbi:MAG: stage 0 sporulation family protein [Clostridia bacterium]|nr:stage 0 sporulation family protein [Clostridia bacterium]
MTDIVGVRFDKACRIYSFSPNGNELDVGDGVIVETVKGMEYGKVVIPVRQVDEESLGMTIKPIIRKANDRDIEQLKKIRQKEKDAFPICKEKIQEHGLEMKLISAEYTFDESKVIFSFTSDGRVDFRELVKDLASVFRTRIELRQIGVRDETKTIGGLGPCGRPCCCSVFLGDFQPVSIKMAKEQNLSLSPTKISGLCGRLMCCLNYEQDYYEDMKRLLPNVNETVGTPEGRGIVVETNPLKQTVRVKIEKDNEDTELKDFFYKDIKRFRREKSNFEEKKQEE